MDPRRSERQTGAALLSEAGVTGVPPGDTRCEAPQLAIVASNRICLKYVISEAAVMSTARSPVSDNL